MLSFAAFAGDGRIELNQASIEADGGFPYTINQSGSYVLTSSLQVPADTDGLILSANRVSIDLNGFRIVGGGFCFEGNCNQGTGSAIRPFSSLFGFHVSMRNGVVIGFEGHCISLDDLAQISDLIVTQCGRKGFIVGENSVVTRNGISATGFEGLEFTGEGANCAVWKSNSGEHSGTVMFGDKQWRAAKRNESPWETIPLSCVGQNGVWCVEDQAQTRNSDAMLITGITTPYVSKSL